MAKLNPFQVRLRRLCDSGKLTRADVALWVGRRYATVNNWFTKGSAPSGPYATNVFAALDRLEKMIKQKRGFPVPEATSYLERPAYITRLRDGQQHRVSKPRSAARRVVDGRGNGAKRSKSTEQKTEDRPTTIADLV